MKLQDILGNELPVKLSVSNIQKLHQEKVDRILYMDTDSSFLWLFKLIYLILKLENKINCSIDEFEVAVRAFTDESLNEIGLTKKELIDYIQDIAEQFEDYINNKLLYQFAELWNIPDKFKEYLSYKQEYIFATLYILAKKNYGYHQIAEKGIINETFDTLNIGQKSDRNPIANKIVKKLLQIVQIHKDPNYTYKQAKMFVALYKKNLLEHPEQAYIPKSLQKRIEDYDSNGQVPRGAMIYEVLFDYSFHPGSKGKLYYIEKFYYRKFDPEKYKKLQDRMYKQWKIKDLRNSLDVLFVPEDRDIDLDKVKVDVDLFVQKGLVDFINVALDGVGIRI